MVHHECTHLNDRLPFAGIIAAMAYCTGGVIGSDSSHQMGLGQERLVHSGVYSDHSTMGSDVLHSIRKDRSKSGPFAALLSPVRTGSSDRESQ